MAIPLNELYYKLRDDSVSGVEGYGKLVLTNYPPQYDIATSYSTAWHEGTPEVVDHYPEVVYQDCIEGRTEPGRYMMDGLHGFEFYQPPVLLPFDCTHLFYPNARKLPGGFNSNYVLDLSSDVVNTEYVTNMSYMFHNIHFMHITGLEDGNTSGVTNMTGMFCNDEDLSEVTTILDTIESVSDISGGDVSKVRDMSFMFYGSYKLRFTDGTFSNLNPRYCTNFESMFSLCPTRNHECYSAPNIYLDLSDWDTAYASSYSRINVKNMFRNHNDYGLDPYTAPIKVIALPTKGSNHWIFSSVEDMFYGCSNLQHIYIEEDCDGSKNYLLSSDNMFYGNSKNRNYDHVSDKSSIARANTDETTGFFEHGNIMHKFKVYLKV